jgi:hypothetical protein
MSVRNMKLFIFPLGFQSMGYDMSQYMWHCEHGKVASVYHRSALREEGFMQDYCPCNECKVLYLLTLNNPQPLKKTVS